MFVSALAAAVYTAIVTMAGVIIGIFAAWMTDRKDKTEMCCRNCIHRMGCACKLDGDNHDEKDCCESWEESK